MKKILIIEGNVKKDNQALLNHGIETHSTSMIKTISNYTKKIEIDVFNPTCGNLKQKVLELDKYDGLIWGGGSMHVYDEKSEIRCQLDFMKECFKRIKKIFAICWGMQVAVVAAGGEVKKSSKGTNIGISKNIELTDLGLKHQLYINKPKKFNTPAYNYDEVTKMPDGAKHLSFNEINFIQGICFNVNNCEIWGIQYHPEITYEKMISLINYREKNLLSDNQIFKNKEDLKRHIVEINNEIEISNTEIRMREVENWLKYSSMVI
tara:strand:- start:1048 stop:1839 length:792 start_codon:yes stop_codon:yes gene_type:complete